MRGTKIKIADAAREILEAEGAEAVTMRRVAAAVGVTPMALYRHFPNREELLQAVAEESFTAVAADWGTRPLPDDTRAALLTATDALLDFALTRPKLYEFMFTARRSGARQYPADFRNGQSPTAVVLAAIVERGIASGQLRQDDVWEAVLTVIALLHGLIQLYHSERIGLSDEDFRALCHRCTLRLVEGLRPSHPLERNP